MNKASESRLSLAREIAPVYAANPGVLAVVVHGSASKGFSDRYSDIEICIFWERLPSDEERRGFVEKLRGCDLKLYDFEVENNDAPEEFTLDGLKIDMGHRSVELVERWISDVVDSYSTDLAHQDMLSLIEHCSPLYGAGPVEGWRARIAHYPDELARRMVREYLDFPPEWRLRMLVEREAYIPLYQDFLYIERNILLTLMGLNRIYFPHLGFKWMNRVISRMRVAPPNLAARLDSVLLQVPPGALTILHDLVEETISLVEAHMPEMDTAEARANVQERRKEWE